MKNASRILVPALIVGAVAMTPFIRTALASADDRPTPMQAPPNPSGGPVPIPTPTPPPIPTPMPSGSTPSPRFGDAGH